MVTATIIVMTITMTSAIAMTATMPAMATDPACMSTAPTSGA